MSEGLLSEKRAMKRKTPKLETVMFHALLPLGLFVCLEATAAENLRLTCAPRTFQVVPGEPVRLQLTVQADSAVPFRWHVPREPLLKLRAIEKLPVRLTAEGVVVYERVVVWQGLEPGTVKIENLSVETKGQKRRFPEVTIHIRDPGP